MRPTLVPDRRRFLQLTGGAVAAGLAGCSTLSAQTGTLDLTLYNQTDQRYTVEMSLFRADGDRSRSEARVFSEGLDVEPDAEVRREAVADVRAYLVRYDVFDTDGVQTDGDHVHYLPDDDGDDGLAFDIRLPGELDRR